jgi:5'(3')-deoxyribonucleotidase
MEEINVGIDLDCTIRDFSKGLIDVYLKHYPHDKGNVVPIDKWVVYSFTPYFPIGKEIQHFLADHPDEINSASPPFAGAVEFMESLGKISKVTIVTYQRNKRWEEVSLDWLDKHGVKFHDIVFIKDKTEFKGKFLLDDCVHNLKAIELSGNSTPVCRDYPWNQDWDGLRAKNYNEFLNIVRSNLKGIEAN